MARRRRDLPPDDGPVTRELWIADLQLRLPAVDPPDAISPRRRLIMAELRRLSRESVRVRVAGCCALARELGHPMVDVERLLREEAR
jgi:hypothetical protein